MALFRRNRKATEPRSALRDLEGWLGPSRDQSPAAPPPPEPLGHGTVELPSGQHRRVAGLSFHTATLRRITRVSPETQGAGWNVIATLVRETDNPHDSNAIGVWVDGEQIGHVNRDDAVALAPLLDDLESESCRSTCRCRIYGGNEGIFGADLWILANSRLTGWVSRQVAAWRSPEPFQPSP
jgi:hypothetical protein